MNALKLSPVGSKYGAPMGRPDTFPDDSQAPVTLHLEQLRMVDGDYDEGGAYWGGSGPAGAMWCAWNDDGVQVFVRASSLDDAKSKVQRTIPAATFDADTELDAFTRAYITCALWTFDDDAPSGDYEQTGRADELSEQLAPETLAKMREECRAFTADNTEALAKAGDDEQNGHDFWLTRNHHGTGFWDRGYDEDISGALTDAAHKCGECDLYRGDDGRIYAS